MGQGCTAELATEAMITIVPVPNLTDSSHSAVGPVWTVSLTYVKQQHLVFQNSVKGETLNDPMMVC